MKEIEKYVESYFGVQKEDLSSIASLFQNTQLKKNDFLLKTGQYSKSMSFIKSGYLRFYALDEKGDKEVTQWISNEGMFVTELSSFVFGTPSRFNIQALSDCELYTISKEKYYSIGDHISNWSELDKLFTAKCFVTLENRVFGLLSMSSEQKVKELMKMNGQIFNQVPLQYIASMLGMTPETLSRMRRKLVS